MRAAAAVLLRSWRVADNSKCVAGMCRVSFVHRKVVVRCRGSCVVFACLLVAVASECDAPIDNAKARGALYRDDEIKTRDKNEPIMVAVNAEPCRYC